MHKATYYLFSKSDQRISCVYTQTIEMHQSGGAAVKALIYHESLLFSGYLDGSIKVFNEHGSMNLEGHQNQSLANTKEKSRGRKMDDPRRNAAGSCSNSEIMNLRNLECVLAREEEVNKKAIVHKAVYKGPRVRYLSKDETQLRMWRWRCPKDATIWNSVMVRHSNQSCRRSLFPLNPEKAVCVIMRLLAKGLYLIKAEMFIIYRPEDSESFHRELIQIEEDLFTSLGLHFKTLDMGTTDLGAPTYFKFDIEAWMPGLEDWIMELYLQKETLVRRLDDNLP